MREKFACMTLLFVFVVASCNRSDSISPSSDDTIQRQEDYSDDVFKENSSPDNIRPQRGSSEADAVGTEDAIVE